jgi:hypothetical protein
MRKSILTVAAATSLFAASSAQAAPDYKTTLGPASPSFAWDGGPGTNVGANIPMFGGFAVGTVTGCTDGVADCEETLIKVETAGKLTITANADDDSNDTLDLYLYESNEAGEYDDGSLIDPDMQITEGSGATEASDEKIEYPVKPGWYVAQVRFFLATNATYKGAAVLSGFAVPAPAAPAAANPAATTEAPAASAAPAAPAAQQQSQAPAKPAAKKTSKKAACQKKAKKVKNKAKRKKALKKCAKVKG